MKDDLRNLQSSATSASWGAVGNLVLTVVKITVGLLAHSQALVADGIHSAADLASSLAVVVGLRVAQMPPDEGHNYGHAKAEAVAQKVVALLLILAGFQIASEAVRQFGRSSPPAPGTLALVVAFLAMVVKAVMYLSQRRVAVRTGSHALMAAARDSWMDVISSGVATVAVLAARAGLPHADAVGAVLVAGLVLRLAVHIFSQAANDLMDRAADPAVVQEIRQRAESVGGVLRISDIRTRVAGAQVLVDLKIEVDRGLTLVEAHEIAHRVKDAVMAMPRLQDVMVHVNPDKAPSPAAHTGR